MALASKHDLSDDNSSDDEHRKKPDQRYSFHGHSASTIHHRRRRSHAFTRVKRGAKRQIPTSDSPSTRTSRGGLGLRSGRTTTPSTKPGQRGTKRRGRPPLHNHGSRHTQRPLIRTWNSTKNGISRVFFLYPKVNLFTSFVHSVYVYAYVF